MLVFAVPRTASLAFKAWIWLLLCAVLLQGGAGAVVQVLGRAHSHAAQHATPAANPAPTWLGSFLAWREARLQDLQANSVFRHPGVEAPAHHHDGLERHHHAPGDTSVQAVDSASSDADQTTSVNPAPAWGPTAEHRAAPGTQAATGWPGLPQPAWSSAPVRLPERPPRA